MALGAVGVRAAPGDRRHVLQEWELSHYGYYAAGPGCDLLELVRQAALVGTSASLRLY